MQRQSELMKRMLAATTWEELEHLLHLANLRIIVQLGVVRR